MKTTIRLLVGVVLCFTAQSTFAKSKKTLCQKYAKDAVRQQFENQKYRCGFHGFKWHRNFNNHLHHCMKFSIRNSNLFWRVTTKSIRSNDSIHREGKLRVCRRKFNNRPSIRVTKQSKFCFRTFRRTYVVAERNGKTIRANRGRCGGWEKHSLVDINGGTLQNGDKVYVRTVHKRFWFGYPSNRLIARGRNGWSVFTIRNVSGMKQIKSGDYVTFQNRQGRYLHALTPYFLQLLSGKRASLTYFLLTVSN